MKVLIVKKNQIGDMVLCLPLATFIKRHHPDWQVYFMGKRFNSVLVSAYADADGFVDLTALQKLSEEQQIKSLKKYQFDIVLHVTPDKKIARLTKKAAIKTRIGTRNRIYHWQYCNKLPALSRKKSPLNEAQLDCFLLSSLGLPYQYSREEIAQSYRYKKIELTKNAANFLDANKFNLLIHPLTRGRHIEWPMSQYLALIKQLPGDMFNVITTEHANDLALVESELLSYIRHLPHVRPSEGQLDLTDLISLIHHADGMIASSTGPIHLAASAGKFALGLYAPIKPFDGRRWGPIGVRAKYVSIDKRCDGCRDMSPCRCVAEIEVRRVYAEIMQWLDLDPSNYVKNAST